MTRTKHLTGLLSSLALAVLPLWADSSVPLDARIAGTIATALTLIFSVSKVRQWSHAILGVLALGTAIAAVVVGKLGAGSAGAFAGGIVLAVLTNLRAIFAKQAVDADATPVVERKTDGGHIRLVALALIGLGFGLALLLMPRVVRAAESQFGGCFAGGAVCAGPSATITVGAFNLATSKFSGGISPGLGYGLTYAPDQWYATGLAGYLSFEVGGGNANHARPALMLSFANYVRVGVGVDVTEQAVGTLSQWSVLFGLGSDFGGTPSYVREVAK